MRRQYPPGYNTWRGMKQRCYNPRNPSYKYYGGLGITVCAAWLTSYEAFLQDVGPPPPNTELDRIDPSGNYTPENCEWVTAAENLRNRRKPIIPGVIPYTGASRTMTTCILHYADGTEESVSLTWEEWRQMWNSLIHNGKRVRSVTVNKKTIEFL